MNASVLNYTDRAATVDGEVQIARLKQDAAKFVEFKSETGTAEKHFVKAVNLGRELGISFEEYYLPAKKELAMGWFNTHYAGELKMSFDEFAWLIGIARRIPDKCKSMADAMPALQLTLFAGELIELPERSESQVSHETTPYAFFFNALRGMQSNLQKQLADADTWDAQTRTSIAQEIERAEAFLAEAKQKLATHRNGR